MIKRGLKRNKSGQEVFGMPFTVIFSIIIIIAVLFTAFFVIRWFLDFQKCSQAGIFLKDLDDAVREAYSDSYSFDSGSEPFTRALPSSVKKVCIADLSKEWSPEDEEEKEILRQLEMGASDIDSNVFLYPPKAVCYEANSKKIAYLKEKEGLYCFDVKDGKVEIRIKKEPYQKVELLRP